MSIQNETGRAGNSADLVENTFSQVDAYNKNTKQKTAVPQVIFSTITRPSRAASGMIAPALKWAARGLPVFPLLPKSKIPYAGTRGFKDATRDESSIREWWTEKPRSNIGISTGDGFFVVDLDGPDAQQWFVKSIGRHGGYDPTLVTKTARGWHLFFWAPVDIPNSTSLLAPHVDVRGNGGYVVAAPSIHPSGIKYKLAHDRPIAEAPRWLTDMAVPDVVERPFVAPRRATHLPDSLFQKRGFRGVINSVATAPEGQRNAVLFWGGCVVAGLVKEGVIERPEGVEELAAAAARAGLPAFEVRLTIASSFRRCSP
jgi:hypothetical protein